MQFPKRYYTKHFIAFVVLLQTTNSAPRRPRLSLADWGQAYHEHGHEGQGTYAFGYDVDDPETGNTQFRDEQRHANGTVTGSYGLLEPDGNVRVVHYIADEKGFRVRIVNSEKPNAEFPATPTAPLVVASESEDLEQQQQLQGELETELLEENADLPPRPSQRPPAATPGDADNGPVLFVEGDSAVVAEAPDPPSAPPPTPANTVVIPGGFVIEIPPDDPEDDGGYDPGTGYSGNEVSPTSFHTRPPTHPIPNAHEYGPILFHSPTKSQSAYEQQYRQPRPTSVYLVPAYNPQYSAVQPTGYYEFY
ncbi:uncharacterized protein LOC124160230 [Ischnura elegans]|uniref:uncharacterized protein LOC124160230 n=1 Tax=Ischnura elegans TaxID=197161 RepID=UPI001ED8734D|nr:uncharacterized protein LOC124160230 [Ischnura elegans]